MEPTVIAPTHLVCPTCGVDSLNQRIDSEVGNTTVASCVCKHGHLFVMQWAARV